MRGEAEICKVLLSVIIVLLVSPFLLYVATLLMPGFNAFIVSSGSMEPAISTGSVVYTAPPAMGSSLNKGDVITYEDGRHLTTHRIHEVNHDNGEYSFVTKGDANEKPDSREVTREDIVGEVFLDVPLVGYALVELGTRQLVMILVLIPAAILILYELKNIISNLR